MKVTTKFKTGKTASYNVKSIEVLVEQLITKIRYRLS